MATTDGLDLFLDQLGKEGVRDSEGFFTVSGDRALQKLAVHQLPRESAWVLKVVQAAVQSRAGRIRVHQSGRSLQFQLHRAYLGTLQQVVDAWTLPSAMATPAQSDLVVALRTVCFAAKRAVILAHHDPEQGVLAIIWDGERLSAIQSATDLAKAKLPFTWVPPGCWAVRVYNKKGKVVRADEFDELTRFAVTCPVPLEMDGRELNHFGLKDVSRERSSIMFSAQTVKAGDLPERRGIRLPHNLGGESSTMRVAWVLYRDAKEQPSRISWVRGGVVVEEEPFHLRCGGLFFRVFVPAEGLETDLTTLTPRFPRPDCRGEWIRLALSQVRDDLLPDEPLAKRIEQELAEGAERSWGMAGIALLGGLLGIPLTKGASVVMTTAYLVNQDRLESARAARESVALREKLVRALESEMGRY
ncbi:MAG: hypothetical protein KC800_00040 [Candidatus Eremiobacteraeota bacterium]|nr:hypothetical protein [Candidatus Eremiobacteraeota bacterium]